MPALLRTTLDQARLTRDVPPRYAQAQFDQFVDAHERYVRRQPRGHRLIMRFVQAGGVDLSGRLLTEADFTGAHLCKARLVETGLERANLYCADLRGADARQANLFRADLRGASLREADLFGANLDEADLRAAVLARADGKAGFRLVGRAGQAGPDGETTYSVDFAYSSMKRARLGRSRLKGANFTGAVLTGAQMNGADLTGAIFERAVVTGVDWKGARLDPGALAGAIGDPTAQARERAPQLLARLEGADLWFSSAGKAGAAAVLNGEDLRPLGGAFQHRRLTALSAENALAVGVSFAGAQLQGARFGGADLRDADFSGADLRGASFKGANLWHARFDAADVSPLPLAGGQGRVVDLTGASYPDDAFATAIRA